MSDDALADYLKTQVKWSRETFGEGKRTLGICAHIAKELQEIRDDPTDLVEWIDVMILAMDGYWRAGGSPELLMWELRIKQDVNLSRKWPPPQPEDHPTEHLK